MDSSSTTNAARRRSAWAAIAGVGVTLGLTELFAGLVVSIPSAISAIGAVVVDNSPRWLKEFAISAFGTADKAVLAISIVAVALVIAWFLGRAAATKPLPLVIGFVVAGALGITAQLAEADAEPVLVVGATSLAVGVGLLVWYGIVQWTDVSKPADDGVTSEPDVDLARRRLMVAIAGAATVTVVSMAVGRSILRSRADAQRAALELPEPLVREIDPTELHDFGLQGVPPIVVGSSTFYRIDTALVIPTIDPNEWTLTIKGMVDQEVTLTYEDISSMPLVERYVTLACVSNDVGDNLVGNALWTGVPLTDLLDMAGVQDGATQIVGRSVDGWATGFPTSAAYDGREPLLAIGMNREVLPAKHGFPARLVVPGLYGYVSATKWLQEIELTTWEAFDGYWVPRGWAKEGPIKTQSRIDRPKQREVVEPGVYAIAGVAYAPTKGIAGVEVRLDTVDGDLIEGEWQETELTTPLSDDSWVQWKLDADLPAGEYVATVRATDGTGFTQSGIPVPNSPNGAEGWHEVGFTVGA